MNEEGEDADAYIVGIKKGQRLVFVNPEYQSGLLSRLDTLRRNRELCDVVLFVDGREIHAHRAVLAGLSPVLYDLFTSKEVYLDNESDKTAGINGESPHENGGPPAVARKSEKNGTPNSTGSTSSPVYTGLQRIRGGSNSHGKWSRQDEGKLTYLEFNWVAYECFEALVDYAYTAKLEIGDGLVADMYKTACMLRVPVCAQLCANYLVDHLNVHNCIGVRRCANKTNDSLLAASVDAYIAENFEAVVHSSKEFSALPLLQVEVIWANQAGFTIPRDNLECRRLGEKVLEWFQTQELPGGKEFRMDQFTEKVVYPRLDPISSTVKDKGVNFQVHLLHAGVDLVLQDCADMDDVSSVGSSDLVQDYKKTHQKEVGCKPRKKCTSPLDMNALAETMPFANGTSGDLVSPSNLSRQQFQTTADMQPTYTPGSTPGTRITTTRGFGSTDSIGSGSNSVVEQDEIECRLVALRKISANYCVALAVLQKQLVGVSVQLIQTSELGVTSDIPEEGDDRTQLSEAEAMLLDTFGRIPITSMTSPRCSMGAVNLNGKVFVCGGYERGECLRTAEEYDCRNNRWTTLPAMLVERGRFDATVADGKVYAVGGSDSRRDLDSAEMYDPVTERWRLLPKMTMAKSNNGCASVEGMVYCIGGWNGQTGIKLCERYNPQVDAWELITPLPSGRSQASCTSWHRGILAVGGCDGWTCTNIIEAYDPRSGAWRMLPKMNTNRRGCGIAVLDDVLYVAGGSDGINSLDSVEMLDLRGGSWTQVPVLTTPRANVRLVAVDRAIYAVGGFNGKTFLNTLESYSPDTEYGWQSWTRIMGSRSRQNSRCSITPQGSLHQPTPPPSSAPSAESPTSQNTDPLPVSFKSSSGKQFLEVMTDGESGVECEIASSESPGSIEGAS